MSKAFKIAFIPFETIGHFKAMKIYAKTIRVLGHNCVFIVNEAMSDKIADQGFEYRCYTGTGAGCPSVFQCEHVMRGSALEKVCSLSLPVRRLCEELITNSYEDMKRIIDDIKPDAIVVDRFIYSPAVVGAGVPWITLITANPLESFSDDNLPPNGTGYAMNSDKTLWAEFRRMKAKAYEEVWERFNTWLMTMNAPALKHRGKFYNESPFLNIYSYPKEVDYYENGRKGKNWFGFDAMFGYNVDNESKVFEIPEKLRERSGKLVYLSMGSLGCDELCLMKRFVSLFSNSKHRFIMSKGHKGHEYELPDNIWGQNYLPQLQVLPLVDLVLTHGGNNTFTECLYFAKPMIVFPLFGDQYDNAQRLVDKGLGVRLDAYECTQTEVFEAMDSLLNDSQLKAKYEKISQRMKNSKSGQMSAKLIEDLIIDHKMNEIIIN